MSEDFFSLNTVEFEEVDIVSRSSSTQNPEQLAFKVNYRVKGVIHLVYCPVLPHIGLYFSSTNFRRLISDFDTKQGYPGLMNSNFYKALLVIKN